MAAGAGGGPPAVAGAAGPATVAPAPPPCSFVSLPGGGVVSLPGGGAAGPADPVSVPSAPTRTPAASTPRRGHPGADDPDSGTAQGCQPGAAGAATTGNLVATPAIVAALRDATGLELNSAPVTPDELAALHGPAVTACRAPVPEVPGEWPVPCYHDERASGQQNLM